MKYLFLALSLGFTINSFAQDPEPELFQTWYLTDIFLEFGAPFKLIEPPVYPFLIISENLDFSGQGSCNTFNGTYMYDPLENALGDIEFNRTNSDCVFQWHNLFESQYFEAVKGPWNYEISDDGVGLQLHIYNFFELSATFINYPLSIPDKDVVNITIYPNPVNDLLNISSENNEISSLIIYAIDGKEISRLNKMNHDMKEISLIKLKSGVYFIEITTDLGKVTKRIVKK